MAKFPDGESARTRITRTRKHQRNAQLNSRYGERTSDREKNEINDALRELSLVSIGLNVSSSCFHDVPRLLSLRLWVLTFDACDNHNLSCKFESRYSSSQRVALGHGFTAPFLTKTVAQRNPSLYRISRSRTKQKNVMTPSYDTTLRQTKSFDLREHNQMRLR